MNKNISALVAISNKSERHIIGLMSGTSLDGLDVAHCIVAGNGETTKITVAHFDTVDYSSAIKDEIRAVFAKKTVDFQHLTLLNAWIANLHAQMILDCLARWQVDVQSIDLIASHGQTVMHLPKLLHGQEKFPNATLQIGDGDHIAVKTGIITVSDFRQKHVAAGGEGAPLAVYGDYFLFGKKGEHRIMLNMGGIANFTYLPADLNPSAVFVTDTGPGNTLLDAFTRIHFAHLSFDKDAQIASQGKVHDTLLSTLMNQPFFEQAFPKTTGPELFNVALVEACQQTAGCTNLSPEDLLATLTRFSAQTIADAMIKTTTQSQQPLNDFAVYMSGGGAHNPLLVQHLKQLLPCRFFKCDDLGISGDAKEAVLFAILANETIAGGESDFGTRRGVPSVTMGKISFPN